MAQYGAVLSGGSFDSTTLTGYLNKTAPRIIKEIQDAIFNESTYLKWMERFGAVFKNESGTGIQMALRMAKNTNVDSRFLATGIPLVGQDQHRNGFETWAQYSGSVVFDRVTLAANSGPEQLIPIIKEEVFNAKTTMRDKVNTDLMTGSGTKPALTGLDSLIAETVTSGSIHGIARSANTWVRNQVVASSCSTTDKFGPVVILEADRLMKDMAPAQGWKKIKLVLMRHDVHSNMLYYMPRYGQMVPQVLSNSKLPGKVDASNSDDAGEYTFRGAVTVWDKAASADSMRFIVPGKEGIALHFLKGLDFAMEPVKRAENSFSTNMLFAASLLQMNHNPLRSGVIYNFDS